MDMPSAIKIKNIIEPKHAPKPFIVRLKCFNILLTIRANRKRRDGNLTVSRYIRSLNLHSK